MEGFVSLGCTGGFGLLEGTIGAGLADATGGLAVGFADATGGLEDAITGLKVATAGLGGATGFEGLVGGTDLAGRSGLAGFGGASYRGGVGACRAGVWVCVGGAGGALRACPVAG